MEKVNVITEIEDLPGEILVYPMHYLRCDLVLAIPKKRRSVKDLRDEIDTHPENEFLLMEVLREFNIIVSKLGKSGINEVKENYEGVHNNSAELLSADIFAELKKEVIEKKLRSCIKDN